jgi:excisionase family DNA binding protein
MKAHQPTFELPNPQDWCTIDGAAQLLGVHRESVRRMIRDGKLTGYYPFGSREGERWALVLLWRPEVDRMLDARKVVAGKAA